ncbi:MAG: Hsp20/alpha crystallin family protein [Clostridiales bacterium]|nr:Hsp20/alpha crystallin family protein [Clostridiales bacterium]
MFTMIPYRRYLSKPSKIFDSMLSDSFFRPLLNDGVFANGFRVDIREKDEAYHLEAELPGLQEDQINLTVDENMLTISADIQTEDKQEEGNRYYCERRTGHVERSFNLDGIDAENIEANYKNGVLYVSLPKDKPAEKTVRKIAIKSDQEKLTS